MARSQSEPPPLKYKEFTVIRPGLNRDVPPGKESLLWVANSATLIYGERGAVLVDTFLTVEQSNGLADAIVASGKAPQGAPAQACRPLMSPRRSIRNDVILQTPMSCSRKQQTELRR